MAIMKVIRDKDGKLINVGDWDYQISREPVMVDSPVEAIDEDTGEKYTYMEKQPAYSQQPDGSLVPIVRQVFGNPMPEGAYEDEADIVVGWDGGLYEASDPRKDNPNG